VRSAHVLRVDAEQTRDGVAVIAQGIATTVLGKVASGSKLLGVVVHEGEARAGQDVRKAQVAKAIEGARAVRVVTPREGDAARPVVGVAVARIIGRVGQGADVAE